MRTGIGAGLDLATRSWWRAVGRSVDLDGAHSWLRAPTTDGSRVGDSWLGRAAADAGGRVVTGRADAGLIADMACFDGPGFAADRLHPVVREFYEHTAHWRMEVWTGWSPWLWPGGELVSRLFGRRVQQLSLPMRPLDVAHGMDSSVSLITGPDGDQRAAAWLRTLRSTGEYVYSGCYSHRRPPGQPRDLVHVAFPLEAGNVQVFLRPLVDDDGSLWLQSPGEPFGGAGAYVVVEQRGGARAARVPVHETFHVYVDADGVLRTDHDLRLWSASAVRLHYRMEPR